MALSLALKGAEEYGANIRMIALMVTNPAIENRLQNIGRQVVKFSFMQRSVRHTDFMKMWEGLPTW